MTEKNKRYFWLKLKDDFFSQKEIKMLRRIAGGDTYTIIYLKMLLLSLKNDGKIYYDGIAENMIEEIALEIDEDVENTQITFNYLNQKGLVEFIDDELEMSNIASMIGSETESAVRKRRQRLKDRRDNVTDKSRIGHTEIEIEKELEIETEREEDTETEGVGVVFDKYSELGFGAMNPFKAEQIQEWLKTFEANVFIKALEIASNNNKTTMQYVNGILNNWKQRGLTTVEKVEAEEQREKVQKFKSGNRSFSTPNDEETRNQYRDLGF